MVDELVRMAGGLSLRPEQQAAFDQALERVRARSAARRTAAPAGGQAILGGGMRRGGGGGGGMQAQMRQRIVQRHQQDFAVFRGGLDEDQRARWDRELAAMGSATFVPLYRLVDGAPQPTMVRVGASDGSNTEVAGDIAAGDVIVTGERPPR